MTKKTPPLATRHVIWLSWKLLIFFSVALCLLALLRLHSQPDPFSSSQTSITLARSRISRDNVFSGPPKIAFLFLARRNLPLDFLWGSFFENADTANFSIYIHSAPGYVFDESTTKSPFFLGRQLQNSIQVKTTDPLSGKPAQRETSTMPQWAGSCWYYLRFMDPSNSKELVAKSKEKYWGPVDVYVGGAEHAVLHLLYARFWHKVLYDIGVVSTKEPFKCVINQGIILGEVQYMACKDASGNIISAESAETVGEYNQERIPEEKVMKSGDSFVMKDNPNIRLIARAHKMSKSRGNVVNPDDVVSEYGADSLRLYEMFMGPLRDSKTWNTSGIEGVHRFLGRTWRLVVGSPLPDGTFHDGTVVTDEEPTLEQLRTLHKCIVKVTEEIEGTRFNTGISAMMEFLNAAYKWDKHPRIIIEAFVLLLSPYAPHMAEELWFRLGHTESLAYEPFPKADSAYLKESTIVLPVQINGKTRGTIQVEEKCSEEDAFQLASQDEKLSKYLNGKSIKKRIFVPGKILNLILDRENVKVGVSQ